MRESRRKKKIKKARNKVKKIKKEKRDPYFLANLKLSLETFLVELKI